MPARRVGRSHRRVNAVAAGNRQVVIDTDLDGAGVAKALLVEQR